MIKNEKKNLNSVENLNFQLPIRISHIQMDSADFSGKIRFEKFRASLLANWCWQRNIAHTKWAVFQVLSKSRVCSTFVWFPHAVQLCKDGLLSRQESVNVSSLALNSLAHTVQLN